MYSETDFSSNCDYDEFVGDILQPFQVEPLSQPLKYKLRKTQRVLVPMQ